MVIVERRYWLGGGEFIKIICGWQNRSVNPPHPTNKLLNPPNPANKRSKLVSEFTDISALFAYSF